MEAIAGIVILAQFVLAAIVGVRLLRQRTTDGLAPERLLGIYFVAGLFAGGLALTVAYAAWQSHGSGETSTWVRGIHAAGQLLMSVGYVSILAFTWTTFHRDATWARALVGLGTAALALSYVGRVGWEGFAISVAPGFHHWLAYSARIVALGWMGIAAFAYWRQMRRRLALGLADPLVTNRFALWALFAFTQIMTALAEPMARVGYVLFAGDAAESAEGVQQVAGGVIQIALLFTSVWGSAGVAILFLTFFPTEGYARWVQRGTRSGALDRADVTEHTSGT